MMSAVSFADDVARPLPRGIQLEPEIVAALDWTEATRYVESNRRGHFAELFVPWERAGDGWARGCLLGPMDADWPRYWLDTEDCRLLDRIGSFVHTGGDGSVAGVWLDDDGRQRYVHLGSGSGSTWAVSSPTIRLTSCGSLRWATRPTPAGPTTCALLLSRRGSVQKVRGPSSNRRRCKTG